MIAENNLNSSWQLHWWPAAVCNNCRDSSKTNTNSVHGSRKHDSNNDNGDTDNHNTDRTTTRVMRRLWANRTSGINENRINHTSNNMYICTHTYVCVCMYACMHACVCARVCACVCAYAYA